MIRNEYCRKSGNGEHVVVEAVMLDGANADEVADWCDAFVVAELDAHDIQHAMAGLNVSTPLGNKRASEGHFIVKYDTGEFYVWPPSEFWLRYDHHDPEKKKECRG